MNLGIYGDSFAEYNDVCHQFNWTVMLSEKFGNCEVEHYGEPSTSLFYSYKKFLENHKKHDLIVFMVTDTCRYTKPIDINNNQVWLSYLDSVEDYKKENINTLSSIDIKILDDVISWFLASDQEFLSVSAELMLNHMETLHDNIIFFPCFPKSMNDEQYKKYNIPKDQCMFNYVCKTKEMLGITRKFWNSAVEIPSIISQHMTPEVNQIVSEMLYNKITTDTWDFSKFENIKLKHPVDYYYKLL